MATKEESLTIQTAFELLKKEGYKVEPIYPLLVLDNVSPFLVETEDEVLLFGSSLFAEKDFYIEIKRFYFDGTKEEIDNVLTNRDPDVFVQRYDDGSFAFRTYFFSGLNENNFISKFEAALKSLQEYVITLDSTFDEDDGFKLIRQNQEFEMNRQRHWFIYEVIDASFKLRKIRF